MMRRGSQDWGFTLLEILIALAITALVLSALYSAYSETLDTTETVENGREVEQVARLALGRMADDFKGLYYRELKGDPKDSPYRFTAGAPEAGDEAGMVAEFATTGHLGFEAQGPDQRINRVRYLLEKQSESAPYSRLIRREYPFAGLQGGGQESELELADGVEGLTFTFVDGEGREAAQWDSALAESSAHLPRLVRIDLRMAAGTSGRSRLFSAEAAPLPW